MDAGASVAVRAWRSLKIKDECFAVLCYERRTRSRVKMCWKKRRNKEWWLEDTCCKKEEDQEDQEETRLPRRYEDPETWEGCLSPNHYNSREDQSITNEKTYQTTVTICWINGVRSDAAEKEPLEKSREGNKEDIGDTKTDKTFTRLEENQDAWTMDTDTTPKIHRQIPKVNVLSYLICVEAGYKMSEFKQKNFCEENNTNDNGSSLILLARISTLSSYGLCFAGPDQRNSLFY